MLADAPDADLAARLSASLGEWYLAINPTFTYVPFQQERLIPALVRHVRRESSKRKLMVMMPPGHSKSCIGTKALVPWYLGNNPGHHAMSICYGDDLAYDFGADIRNVCTSDIAQAVFPGLQLTKDSRSIRKFTTEQENIYYAASFNATVAGRRLNLVVIDDPVKSMEEAESDAAMSARMKIYRSVVDARLTPGGIVLAFLTRYSLSDWAARVLQFEGDEWDVLVLDAENEDGSFLWESHYGKEKYETIRRKDPEVWWSVWRQQPRAYTANYFDPAWWLTYKHDQVKKEWQHYMLCDPSAGIEGDSDRTSIIVFAAGPERRLFIRDWVYDRLDPDQRADACCRLIRKWKPARFVYEETGLVSDTFYLTKRLIAERISLRPISVGKRGPRSQLSKDQRIRELVNDFREGLLWFPDRLLYKCVNGEVIDVIQEVRDNEFIPYRGRRSIPHDDGLDSLSRIHEPELNIRYVPAPDEGTHDDQRRTQPRVGWEGVI
jgi:hypothetical protein